MMSIKSNIEIKSPKTKKPVNIPDISIRIGVKTRNPDLIKKTGERNAVKGKTKAKLSSFQKALLEKHKSDRADFFDRNKETNFFEGLDPSADRFIALEQIIKNTVSSTREKGPGWIYEFMSFRFRGELEAALRDSSNHNLSVEEFSNFCEEQRVEEIRQYYQVVSGKEFNELLKKWGINRIRQVMQLPNPKKRLSYKENIQFLDTEIVHLGELPKGARRTFREIIYAAIPRAVKKYEIPKDQLGLFEELIIGIIFNESRGDPLAISSTYHLGIAQLGHALYSGRDYHFPTSVNPFNPREAIPRAVEYFAKCWRMFDGNTKKAVTAYNTGFKGARRLFRLQKNKPNIKVKKPHFRHEGKNYYDDVNKNLNLLKKFGQLDTNILVSER